MLHKEAQRSTKAHKEVAMLRKVWIETPLRQLVRRGGFDI
jgi:hypothetical protein